MQPSRHPSGPVTEPARVLRSPGHGRALRGPRSGLLLAAVLLVPLAGCTEEPAEEAVTIAEDADPQALMTELQGIQQELAAIQEQAFQDPELQSERDSLERRLEAEIDDLDPEAPAKRERAGEIAAEFQTAQEVGDTAEATELAMENRELQASLQQTRGRVLETQEMSTAVESFQEEMLVVMNEVDPRTDSLVARAEAIVAHLQEAMAQRQAPPVAPPAGAPDTM